MDGIKQHMHVEEVKGDIFEHHELLQQLPNTLADAKKIARESSFVKNILPQDIIDWYCR